MSSFIEYEYWTVKKGFENEYEEMIKKWFEFLKDNREELFPEWLSAKYFQQTDRDGNPTGTYIMLFEYKSIEAHHAYKERRKNWDGPYAEYKKVDPYQFFDIETCVTEYWRPLEKELWADFTKKED